MVNHTNTNKFMRVFIVLFAFAGILNNRVHSQVVVPPDSTKKFYDKCGVIFEASYDPGIIIRQFSKRFTPTFSDIIMAENLFLERYNQDIVNDPNYKGFEDSTDVRSKYANYSRQYVGYIDINGQKNIIIQFLNFDIKEDEKKKYFPNWEKWFINGSGGFYEINIRIFLINIDSKSLCFF
jgi:hypothetical protein